jgi:hypothetical protein
MLIVTQSMEAHVAKRRTGKGTITIITTTWTIRWWDGAQWVEQTLAPSIEIVAGGEVPSNPDGAAYDAAPAPQEPPREPKTDQPIATQEAKP